jgi:hypothetical protein
VSRWPPSLLFGLWVDLGHQTRGGRWLRPPVARFSYRHGCAYATHPAHDGQDAARVAEFTAAVTGHHARHCPGPPDLKETP